MVPSRARARDLSGTMAKRNAALDSPEAQQAVINTLEAGGTLDDAAAKLGVSRRAIRKFAEKNPTFEQRIEAARERARVAADLAPRVAASLPAAPRQATAQEQADIALAFGVPLDVVRDVDSAAARLGLPLLGDFMRRCMAIAEDPDHRANSTALRMCGEWYFGPVVRAQQRAEARAAEHEAADDDEGVVIVCPPNGTEAPGYEPREQPIDVEVIG